jgi:hypothetical protein
MKRLACTVLLVGLSGCTGRVQENSAPSIVGSWRLVSWTVEDGRAQCADEEGGGTGQIMYSRDGHMSAQLGCAGLSTEKVESMDASEAIGLMTRRHFSYYGTYSVDETERTVTHHVLGSSAESWVGTDRVRRFEFEGPDRIALSTTEFAGRLVWERNARPSRD